MTIKIITIFIFSFGLFFIYSFNNNVSNDNWEVPEKYKKMKNPMEADKASLSIGKSLYNKHCKSCHGKEGLGDGSKAAQLETSSGDFTEDAFIAQSDGSKFYKTLEGRDDMPSFKKKIPDADDIWHIINYIDKLGD